MQTTKSFLSLSFRAGQSWFAHRAPSMGAAIAFYTLFSMAPILWIAITVISVVFDQQAAHRGLLLEVQSVLGANAAKVIGEILNGVSQEQGFGLRTVTALTTSLFAATTVFGELKDSLDIIWEAPKRHHQTLLWAVRRRVLSFGIVLSLGFVLLASMLVSTAISVVSSHYGGMLSNSVIVVNVIDNAVSTIVITLLFAAIFKFLPDRQVNMRVVWKSALLTAVLYMFGKNLIATYLGTTALASSYGAAGALVLILIWVYYSAQVFLFGAELSRQMMLLHTDQPRTVPKSERAFLVTRNTKK